MAGSNVRRSAGFRLSPGPYDLADRAIGKAQLQAEFFNRVDVIAPMVFTELRTDVYPAFKAHPDHTDLDWRYFSAFDGADHDHLAELVTWLRRWHVEVPWFARFACDALDTWTMMEPVDPCAFWRHRTCGGSAFYSPLPSVPHTLQLPRWDGLWQDWAEIEAAMRNAFDAYIPHYRALVEGLIQQSGMQPAEHRRNIDHLNWLIRYQVLGLSRREIAERLSDTAQNVNDLADDEITEDAVRKAIKDWANLLELPLRKHRARRPPTVRASRK